MATCIPPQRGNSESDDGAQIILNHLKRLKSVTQGVKEAHLAMQVIQIIDWMMINHGDDEISDDSDGPTARRNIGRREQILYYISIIGKMFAMTIERSHYEYDIPSLSS